MLRFSTKLITGFFFLSILYTSGIFSQQFVAKYDYEHLDDRAFGIVTDLAGNIYEAGYITSSARGEDMALIKYNSAGIQQWVRTYNGPGNSSDRAFGVVVDNTGNIIITGYSTGVGSGADFTTIKYNSEGVPLWVERYNAPVNGDDRAFGIVADRVGNIYVTGYIALVGTDIYTIKYNAGGIYIWGKVISGTGNGDDRAFGIVVDSLGNNIYICGYTDNDSTGIDFSVARYDSSGTRIWLNDSSVTGNSDDKAFGIVVDRVQNIYVTGYSTGVNSGMDLTTRKYSNSGSILWTSIYNDTAINSDDRAFGIVVDADGNSYVTGYTTADTNGRTDYLTLKYSSSGQTIWKNTYNGTGNYQDTAMAICLAKHSEHVFVTGGSSRDTIPGKMDIMTLRYDIANGELVDSSRYNGGSNRNDIGNSIASDTAGNIFVGGFSDSTGNSNDFLAMKYLGGVLIGINQISTEVPKDYRLYQNYPNPFNPTTKIKFDVKKSSMVKLVIYDILGRQVNILVNEILKVGTYEVDISMHELSSGIYFYELSSESYRESMKMALIK